MVRTRHGDPSGLLSENRTEHVTTGWPADSWRSPILAVRLSSLGDVLVALDAIGRLKARRPDMEIDLLTRSEYAGLCSLCPHIRKVLVAERAPSKGESYEVLWDLQGGVKGRRSSQGLRWVSRFTYPSYGCRRRAMVLLGRRISSPPHELHRFLRPAAGEQTASVGELRCGEALLDVASPRREKGVTRVGLAPHAKHRLKEWPFPRFLGLARLLEGESIETRWFLDPSRSLPNAPLDPARTVRGPLEDVVHEMAGCDVVVSGDTGLGHLASALGLPVAVIYGSTVPELGYTPTGSHTVIEVDLPCRPCHVHGATRCWLGHRRCLRDITPDLVFRQTKMLLHRFGVDLSRRRVHGNLA